jgi:phage antirepressor YoqD-like protein
MSDIVVKNVNFNGDILLAAQDEYGKINVAIYYVCKALRLTEGQMKNERLRIQDDIVLSKGGRKIILPTNGGPQEVLCLELDFLPLWLAKINANIISDKSTQDKLIAYQLKAKDVLAQAFLDQKPALPSNFAEACRMLADEWEEKQKLLPKANYYDNLISRNALLNFRDTTKELHVKQSVLTEWLIKHHYVYCDRRTEKIMPFAEYVPSLFETKEYAAPNGHTGVQTLITVEGRHKFMDRLQKEGALCLSQ